jgi:ABC-type transport system involved in cytochrome c biogenesis permease subunit
MKYLLYISGLLYLLSFIERRLIYSGFIAGAIYLFLRAETAGRLPITGPHDTLVLFSAFTGIMSLLFEYSKVKDKIPYNLTGLTSAILVLSALFFEPANAPLPPVLMTFWFELHVVTAFISYALFGAGLITGIAFLLRKEPIYEELQYKSILTGYSLFSFSMIAGGIWAFYAWGSFWLWTPKELWTSIVWLFYTLYLHMRVKGINWERVNTFLGMAGFGVVLFTYLGVSLLMKSSHSF